MALLDVKNLTKNFGGLTAVGDVTLELNEGELVGLIGPNGAGKTTLFNLLTGVYEPSEGSVELDGTLLNGKTPYKIASLGLSRTFQNIRLFKNMTVIENVLVGMENTRNPHLFSSFLRLPSFYSNETDLQEKAIELLKIFNLDDKADTLETAELTELIRQIKEEFSITIMLIEHDMSLVMDVTERIYVLEYGRLIAQGTPEEIKHNKRVIEAYLGGEA